MSDIRLHRVIRKFLEKTINVEIVSNIELNKSQVNLLHALNNYCAHQSLNETEAFLDPRKITYMSNQEIKFALVAILLASSLSSPLRRKKETKEYFYENIEVYNEDENIKFISFGEIDPRNVLDSLYEEIFQDWMIYRDKEGRGIFDLIDEKTNLKGLSDYVNGGEPLYEFARFHRKYREEESKRKDKAQESAQEVFRNSMISTLAKEYSKQQLLQGVNPMDLIEDLFDTDSKFYQKPQKRQKLEKKIDPDVEDDIVKFLEAPRK